MERRPARKARFTPKYDSTRQQNVLLEKIYSEVRTVAEGHSGLNHRMDGFESRMVNMESRMVNIEGRMVGMEEKLVEHDRRFDRVESAIIENSRDIKKLYDGQEELKAGVKEIGQRLAIITTDHEQRIQRLEAKG
jgi:chromosome segregation ATPase